MPKERTQFARGLDSGIRDLVASVGMQPQQAVATARDEACKRLIRDGVRRELWYISRIVWYICMYLV